MTKRMRAAPPAAAAAVEAKVVPAAGFCCTAPTWTQRRWRRKGSEVAIRKSRRLQSTLTKQQAQTRTRRPSHAFIRALTFIHSIVAARREGNQCVNRTQSTERARTARARSRAEAAGLRAWWRRRMEQEGVSPCVAEAERPRATATRAQQRSSGLMVARLIDKMHRIG